VTQISGPQGRRPARAVADSGDTAALWDVHLPPGFTGPLDLLADGSLPARWARRWRERPSWPQLRDIDGRWLTSAELEQRSRSLAARLRAAGFQPGSRIVLSGESSAKLVVAHIAALRAGLVVVPLNPAYTRSEVARIVADAQPAAALVQDPRQASWAAEAAPSPLASFDLDGPAVGEAADSALDRAAPGDPALLIYTSGTTGRPKGAALSHGNLLASATAVALAWRWSPGDRLLLTLPLFHVHGLGVGLNGTLCAGASAELRPRFEVEDVLERCAPGAGITLLFGVPAMYQRLAQSGRARELAALRLIVSGSAPLPPALAHELAAATGQLPLERYGMTETVMLASNPCDGERRPGTVGFPLPGVELRLAGDGEIQVRGPNVISGYWRAPEATAEAFTADGWFRTGDLGELDPDGYLQIAGRSKELIITGGYNVHPREVEERLLEHPDVREAAVVGLPSERWGEEVTAFVVAERSLPVDLLRAHAAEALAPYKVPKRFEFVSELPRNALGKVVRSRLRSSG
jgi:malonyl-CoA/methylmalonyl-CoA synthetase